MISQLHILRKMLRRETNTLSINCMPPQIGWILLGDINTGSSRIHGINIHNYLLNNGIKSTIFQTNTTMQHSLTLFDHEKTSLLNSGINVLIFQKVHGKEAVSLARKARKNGIRTIYVLSDLLDNDMVNVVDAFVVTSDFLKTHFDTKYGTKAIVIDDALEVDDKLVKKHIDADRLKLIWVGHQDNWPTLAIVRDALAKISDETFSLKTISNHPQADVRWELSSVADQILAGDIAVIPTAITDWGNAKSNNRLTMFMSLGLPVIVSEIPAYKKIIINGHNGFLAKNIDDWVSYLKLMKNYKARQAIGTQARKDVLPVYGINTIGEKWLSLITSLLSMP